MEREQVDNLISEFVMRNDADFSRVSRENPMLYDAVMGAVSFLSKKFGTGTQKVEDIKEQIAEVPPVQERSTEIIETPTEETKPESVIEIKSEQAEELTESELKTAIQNLKPLAEFDDEVKQELESLKARLKALKKKKS